MKKTVLLTTLALTFLLGSCIGEQITPEYEYGSERNVSIHFTEDVTTRAISDPVGQTPVNFTRGDLYLVTTVGTISRHFTISDDAPSNVLTGGNHINTTQLRTEGVEIPSVPGNIRRVVIVGNTTGNTTSGNVSSVGERAIEVFDQWNAANVNLWGEADLRDTGTTSSNGNALWAARDGYVTDSGGNVVDGMMLRPTVARIEVRQLKAYGEIASFNVEGIFIDKSYRQARVSGTPFNLMSRGQDPTLFVEGQPGYENTTNFALYDAGTARFAFSTDGNNNILVTPPNTAQRWTYNLFAVHGSNFTQKPRIVIRLSDVTLDCGFVYPQDQFVTVRGFRNVSDGQMRDGIRAGNIYQLDIIPFSERNLSPRPNENFVYANVTITLALWNGVNLQTPGFHQPSPLGGEVDCGDYFEFNTLGKATCGYCVTGTITYLWLQSTDRITWVAANEENSLNNLASGHFTTANLTETTYFRRRATCSCSPNRHNYTFWARVETDCVKLSVTSPLVFFPVGGTLFSTITTNTSWEVTSYSTWLASAFTPVSGLPTDRRLYVKVGNSNVGRTGYIYISTVCGTETERVDIIQLGISAEPSPLQFVGAFWRNDQMGERLIRMNQGGDAYNTWMATASHEWIKLDFGYSTTQFTSDDGVTFNRLTEDPTSMTDNDDLHRLPTSASGMINGQGAEINFRIGLRSVNPNPHPRYGQVVVMHNNSSVPHIIWIRQGEAADYVFDSHPNGDNRASARRFSPFNLKAYELNENVGMRIQQEDDGWDGNRSKFTAYPTQTGAFFMWAGSHTRRAFAPVGGFGASWGNQASGNWNTLGNTHESCPPGWRRPNDGPITHIVTSGEARPNSEMRQSLFLNPPTGTAAASPANFVWGFYADGFFDRRAITNAAGLDVPNAGTVAAGTYDIANRGALFFNPRNSASLFFPATGNRVTDGGIAGNVGDRAFLWSSTSGFGEATAWFLEVINDNSFVRSGDRRIGAAIRCVVE